MTNLDFEAWRCKHDMNLFCPDEGCPSFLGCARDRGWKRGEPTPPAYRGDPNAIKEILEAEAQSVIWQFDHPVNGKCPPFCHSPNQCRGKTSCPQSYACSE